MRKLTAYESGRRAFFGGHERAPMNDAMFVRAMYSDIKSKQILGLFFNGDANGKRQLKLDYIQQWKAGWDDAKDGGNTVVDVDPPKKTAKKASKKKAKK